MARRVVTPKSNAGRGTIAQTKARGSMGRFRCSRASDIRTRPSFEKSPGLINPNMSLLGLVLI